MLKEFSEWKIGATCDKDVSLYVDIYCLSADVNTINVAYVHEPEGVMFICHKVNNFWDMIVQTRHKFKYILTDIEKILDTCSNAVFFEYGLPWVMSNPHPDKVFAISTVVGHKVMTEYHHMRHELWHMQDQILNPKMFYRSHFGGPELMSGNIILNDDKSPVFKSQFQIVIENMRSKYRFTEKITDCFVAEQVPIYFGATDIGQFFDIRGILVVNSLDEIVKTCNDLTPRTYESMLPYVRKNAELVGKYKNFSGRLTDKLKTLGL